MRARTSITLNCVHSIHGIVAIARMFAMYNPVVILSMGIMNRNQQFRGITKILTGPAWHSYPRSAWIGISDS